MAPCRAACAGIRVRTGAVRRRGAARPDGQPAADCRGGEDCCADPRPRSRLGRASCCQAGSARDRRSGRYGHLSWRVHPVPDRFRAVTGCGRSDAATCARGGRRSLLTRQPGGGSRDSGPIRTSRPSSGGVRLSADGAEGTGHPDRRVAADPATGTGCRPADSGWRSVPSQTRAVRGRSRPRRGCRVDRHGQMGGATRPLRGRGCVRNALSDAQPRAGRRRSGDRLSGGQCHRAAGRGRRQWWRTRRSARRRNRLRGAGR